MSSGSPPVPTVLDTLMTDEVMKRRLLIDGDGTGDDRRILGLTKAFLSLFAEEPGEESESLHKKLLSQLSQIEHGYIKTQFGTKANKEVIDMYVELDSQVKDEIETVREEIESSKKQLELAKEHRKHQQEYNALAQLIRTQLDRKETEFKKQRLENELAALQSKQKGLDQNLDQRRRSMHVLMSAITRLEEMINEEEQEARALEEAEKLAAEEKLLKLTATPKPVVPMEVDDPSRRTPLPSSNPGSPLEQITPEGPGSSITQDNSRPAGTVSSVPDSPAGKEKYDDLSESE